MDIDKLEVLQVLNKNISHLPKSRLSNEGIAYIKELCSLGRGPELIDVKHQSLLSFPSTTKIISLPWL
jgi:hypothetical protein